MATINTGMITDKINGITVNSSIKCNSANYTNKTSRDIKYIVMHYTGNSKDTAASNAKYFNNGSRSASAHFFCDDTTIYQSVELRDTAWHCGTSGAYYHNACRNANSIGIEMCCTAGNYKISDTTKKNAAYLCAYICKMIGISADKVDTYVLRHYDITRKQCPAQMVTNASEWTAFKTMVKNILNGSNSSNESTKETSTTTSSTITTGAKLNLSNVSFYNSATTKTKSSTKTGTYYVWSNVVTNGRIRVTNSSSNVGKSGQITGWINESDAKKSLTATSTTSASNAFTTTNSTTLKVKVKVSGLNIRSGAGTNYKIVGCITDKGTYTITETSGNWGKLKSGAGWINISTAYVEYVK